MTNSIKTKIIKLDPAVQTPTYGTEGSAAFDLRVFFKDKNFVTLEPSQSVLLRTGIRIYIEDVTLAGIIIPRSGLGAKDGIVLGNLVGLIDSDYQGEIMVSCWNRSQKTYHLTSNDKLCQMLLVPVARTEFELVEDFGENTSRAEQGFGHTGKS